LILLTDVNCELKNEPYIQYIQYKQRFL